MLKNVLKNYPLSCLVVIAIFYLSLFTPPEMPELEDIRFIDKWTHLCMYGGLTLVVLYEYFRQHGLQKLKIRTIRTETLNWRHGRLMALWFPIILGGAIELIQAYCTQGRRSGEMLDWVADALGSILVFCILRIVVRSSKP